MLMTATTACIELNSTNVNDRIALRGVKLRSHITGLNQKTTIEQTFVNREDHAIEAVYTFPLPDDAAVCGYEIVTGDHVLTGQIEEIDDAIDRYSDAINRGDGAYMVESHRPDIFTAHVGNLNPCQAATVRLTYIAALRVTDDTIRIAYPTTVAPRYVTATGGRDPLEATLDGDAVNPPHVLHVPYGLSIEVEIDGGLAVSGVTSPSHTIVVTRSDKGGQTVALADQVTEMDRDVVLSLSLAEQREPVAYASTGPEGDCYVAVSFVPEFDHDQLPPHEPSESFFVIDCSGSMQGQSIAQARRALELCLRSLSEGDHFNICCFGSTYRMMSGETLVYSQTTLERATAFVNRINADLGGTELHGPLSEILVKRPSCGESRQVILLTDGQISNESSVIELAQKHCDENRFFTFGIGSACSNLVNGLARSTGGASEFITQGEAIEDKVLRTFGRIGSPKVTEVQIDWGHSDNARIDLASDRLPPIFDGDAMNVLSRVSGDRPAEVTLRCKTPIGPAQWSVPVIEVSGDDLIPKMWARRRIQSLDDAAGNSAGQSYFRQRRHNREKSRVVELSKAFGVMCAYTTFIAIEHRSEQERNAGQPELRRVPVMLAQGWGDVELAGLTRMACASVGVRRMASASFDDLIGGDRLVLGEYACLHASAQPSLFQAILMSQSADGRFERRGMDVQVAMPFEKKLEELLDSAGGFDDDRRDIITTILNIIWLRTEYADERDQWSRAEAKAMRYLKNKLEPAIDLGTVIDQLVSIAEGVD